MTFSTDYQPDNNSENLPKSSDFSQETNYIPEVRERIDLALWEEKLTVNRRKKKVGEVVIRKQVETRMIQIPVREEKLIIEKIGENPERLAEVILSEDNINGFTKEKLADTATLHITKSHYLDVAKAQKLLDEIARLSSHQDVKICLNIVTNNSESQIEHQSLCDRYI